MVKKNYNFEFSSEEKIAKAFMSNQPISLKYSTELARELKGKRVDKAEKFLERIIRKEEFLPLRRYNKKVAHRKGNAKSFVKSGRFPVKTAKKFLELLNLVKSNADYKGLDPENLLITHVFASQGFRRFSFQPQGRIAGKRRRKKSTHLEIVVMEAK
jgi:large subunit ribosomal protein L22